MNVLYSVFCWTVCIRDWNTGSLVSGRDRCNYVRIGSRCFLPADTWFPSETLPLIDHCANERKLDCINATVLNQETSPRTCLTQEAAISMTNDFYVNPSGSPPKLSISDCDWPYHTLLTRFFSFILLSLSLSLSLSPSLLLSSLAPTNLVAFFLANRAKRTTVVKSRISGIC